MANQVPDHIQNATRVAFCVFVSCVVGYGVIVPWSAATPGASVIQIQQACKWSAITSVVIAQPVIGKLSQVGAERIIGTVAGGLIGFGTYELGKQVLFPDPASERDDGVVLALCAFCVAFFSVWMGNKLKLDYSAKLFTMTFLLVTFAARDSPQNSGLLIMVTRISGICAGVILSLLVSLFIFPRSASQEAIKQTAQGLQALAELSKQVWSEGIRDNLNQPSVAAVPAAVPAQHMSNGYTSLAGSLTASDAEAAKNEDLCEEKLTVMYNSLSKVSDFVTQSQGEIFMGSIQGRACFFPGLPWYPTGLWRLPATEFQELASSMKALARLLFALHLAFDEGFDDDLLAMLRQQYPSSLLPVITNAAQGVLADTLEAFPSQPFVSPSHLHRLHQAVEGLLAISDYQRRRVFQRLRPEIGRLTRVRRRPRRLHSMRSPAASEAAASPRTGQPARQRSFGGTESFSRRFGSPTVGSPPDSRAMNLRQPNGAAPAHSAGAAAAVAAADAQPGQEALGETEQHQDGRSAFEAFSQLPPDMRITVASDTVSEPPTSPSARALRNLTSLSTWQGPQGEQLDIRLQRVPSTELLVFPDTAQGYASQVRWYSFQFLIAEIAEEMQELFDCLSDLLTKMPADGRIFAA